MPYLHWEYDYAGQWDAYSQVPDENGEADYVWRITVCNDGTFDVNESHNELLSNQKWCTFDGLGEAQTWCQQRENMLRTQRRIQEMEGGT